MTPTTQTSSVPRATPTPLDRAKQLATVLLSQRGEASGALVARELHGVLRTLDANDRYGFQHYLSTGFQPDTAALRAAAERYRPVVIRLCATYLTRRPSPGERIDPVARFHLGNGARLERINWLGSTEPRAVQESFGIMVNYLYDHDSIEDNHEAFVHDGTIARSADVDALLQQAV